MEEHIINWLKLSVSKRRSQFVLTGEIAENLILIVILVEMKSCVQLIKHDAMEICVSFELFSLSSHRHRGQLHALNSQRSNTAFVLRNYKCMLKLFV